MKKRTLSPQIQAEIAIKALITGNLRKTAEEYGVNECVVYVLQKALMDNSADLFLLLSGEESILKMLNTVRDQIDWIQESLDEISAILEMSGGEKLTQRKDYGLYDF